MRAVGVLLIIAGIVLQGEHVSSFWALVAIFAGLALLTWMTWHQAE
ncbi:MAG: hypothetical protein ACM3JG_15055 [Thiohalocapsa sp.]